MNTRSGHGAGFPSTGNKLCRVRTPRNISEGSSFQMSEFKDKTENTENSIKTVWIPNHFSVQECSIYYHIYRSWL